jgi:peptide/nickel transport system substrate-binding protein
MQNRFGLKDFVLLVLVLALIVSVWLKMIQSDRHWEKAQTIVAKLQGLESQVSRLEGKVDAGVRMAPGSGQGAAIGATAGGSAAASTSGPRDDSWARPGIPIEWQPEPGFASNPFAVAGAQDGGEFTEIWEAQTKVLTPLISTDVYSRRVQEVVLESLGDLDPQTLKMRGLLAEAWQLDPEGLWLRARIRAAARFSDGQPVTAEDIRWTFHEYLMNEQLDAERSRSIMRDSIKEVKAIDERTVEFVFRERLFTNISNALGMFVLPKHYYSRFSPAQINQSTGLLVGSGPFRLRDAGGGGERQWSPPADVVVERNAQYWGPKPRLASIRFQAINEEIARLNSFRKGDADMITPSSPQFVTKSEDPEWTRDTEFLKWINMRCGYSFIAWNCGERNGKPTPFADKRVRQAMTMLLDREKMIRDIWKGIGVVAKGNMPLESPGANKDIQPWPFDRRRALDQLKALGWDDRDGDGILEDSNGNPFTFEYSYAGGSEISERVARFVKDAYQEAGIVVTLRSADWSVYQDFLKKRDFDAITLGWGANSPESDPKQIFHSESIQNQGDNFAQWNSPEADRLIEAGRREMDPEKRAKIWQQLEAVLHEEQPYTFVRVAPWLRFSAKRLGNVQMYPSGLVPQEFVRLGGPATPKPAN